MMSSREPPRWYREQEEQTDAGEAGRRRRRRPTGLQGKPDPPEENARAQLLRLGGVGALNLRR